MSGCAARACGASVDQFKRDTISFGALAVMIEQTRVPYRVFSPDLSRSSSAFP